MKSLAILVVLCASGGVSAVAQARIVPTYFESVASKLPEIGFRDATLLDAATGKMHAFDRNGRGVVLTVHPRNGTLVRIEALNPGGK